MRYLLSLSLLCSFSLYSQSITTTSGLTDDQVLQRDESDRTTVTLSGTASGLNNRAVEVRATGKYGVVPNLDWTPAGKVVSGKWTGRIVLPVGGPYRVEVRSMAATAVVASNVLVGDLWVLGGQSNMEGVGDLIQVEPPHGLVHSLDMMDKWVLAEEPLHLLPGAVDRVHWRKNAAGELEKYDGAKLAEYITTRAKGAGLGLPFAREMVRRTGVPIGLIPCAHGGTSMDQWSPEMRDKGGDSLYGATLRRVKLAGGRVRGILWYQGESDANPKAAPLFAAKFEKLVAAFRSDVGQAELPFYYVQIGRHTNLSNVSEWNTVQDLQRKAEGTIPRTGMAPSVDLELDDQIHVGTQDLKRLGVRLANLACHDLFPKSANCGTLQRGPRPVEAKVMGNLLRVSFQEVNGRLRSLGRVAGFTIHDASGAALPLIYRIRMDPQNPYVLLLHLTGATPAGATLRYGAGKDPLCNVVDEADMALPVFQVPIQ